MELIQLRYFIQVAESQNITATAKKLFISQPALSASIARLEGDLGVKLFKRQKNRIVLTEAGTMFLTSAKKAIAILDESVEDIRNCSDYDKTHYTIVSALRTVTRSVNAFTSANPNIRINIVSADTHEVFGKIANGSADFGISLFPVKDPDLESVCVMKGFFCAGFPMQQADRKYHDITLEALSKHRLLCSRFGNTRQFLERVFSDHGMHVEFIELDAKDLLFDAVAKGLGVAICIPMLSDRAQQCNLTDYSQDVGVDFIPISDAEITGEIHIVTRKGFAKSKTLEQIISFISNQFHENETMLQELIARTLTPDTVT